MKGKMIAAVAATALIVGFSALNASAWGGGHHGQILKSRFARGEISPEEYQRMKGVLMHQ